ncbi:hypothetical protein NDU88_000356 [Pleurodeles waltl]|uniref:Uncharacterized protein n=1 Tax=Pleurodeles waltl TaxID=8319 RepID=A0AAV7TFL3_PLEWA|nr:hypothetical protein NDU88_000356 [Pleurodeles waltl]
MGAPGTQGCGVTGENMRSPPEPLVVTLAEHSQRFDEILNTVLDIKATLEPKTDALRIDMGHMREDHKNVSRLRNPWWPPLDPRSHMPPPTSVPYRKRWLNYDNVRRIKKVDLAAIIFA